MNHIQQIISDLSNTSDDAKSATWQRLIIRAICALAQEARRNSNMMAWGAPGDIPPRVPAEAGQVAWELDQGLADDLARAEAANREVKGHNCTKTPRSDSVEVCDNCADLLGCNEPIPF